MPSIITLMTSGERSSVRCELINFWASVTVSIYTYVEAT